MKNKNLLTDFEQKLLKKIEKGEKETFIKNAFIWTYLDGKRNGCKTFDERVSQIASNS